MDTLETILSECAAMQEFLSDGSAKEPEELLDRLRELNSYMARSGELLAVAKSFQDGARMLQFGLMKDGLRGFPATTVNKIVESSTKAENFAVNWLDRINRGCVHQSDNLRTLISFCKESMSLTRKGY